MTTPHPAEQKTPQPNDIYEDEVGCTWTVVGVHDRPSVVLESETGERITPAIDSPMFAAMRVKAKPRCEPPEWAKGDRWHWVQNSGDPFPVEWISDLGCWKVSPNLGQLGFGTISPEDAAGDKWKWRYHSVARPTSPQVEPRPFERTNYAGAAPLQFSPQVEPSDEAIEEEPPFEEPRVPMDAEAISGQEAWAIISPQTGRAIISSVRSTRFACMACWMRDHELEMEEFRDRGFSCVRLNIAVSEDQTDTLFARFSPAKATGEA